MSGRICNTIQSTQHCIIENSNTPCVVPACPWAQASKSAYIPFLLVKAMWVGTSSSLSGNSALSTSICRMQEHLPGRQCWDGG
jgi:hypothetical protein